MRFHCSSVLRVSLCALAMPAAMPGGSGVCLAQPTFRALGHLPGGSLSIANGVSAEGAIVVGQADSSGSVLAFRWQSGIPASIGLAPGWQRAEAWSISGDGTTIVGTGGNVGGPGGAFRWTAAGGFESLPGLPGTTYAQALAASHSGTYAAGVCIIQNAEGQFQRAVWWTPSGVHDLGTLPGGAVAEARGISADGLTVAGYAASATRIEAFRWTTAGLMGLGVLPGDDGSVGLAISGDGLTVVGSSIDVAVPSQVHHPFRWTAAGGMQPLPMPPGATSAEATGVSHDGSVIVGYATGAGAKGAVIWTSAGVQYLSTLLGAALPPGWVLNRPNAISRDGTTVVGVGSNGTCGQAWVVRLDGAPIPQVCYANCTGCRPVLTVADFACFQNRFVANDPYADCNQDAAFTISDFGCFQGAFTAGCP